MRGGVYHSSHAAALGGVLAVRRFLFRAAFLFLMIDGCLFLYSRKDKLGIQKKTVFRFMILLLLTFCSSIPLVKPYLFSEAHDLRFHLMRIVGLAESFRSYMFPVRIQQSWLSGHGYAASIFYGDVFLYLPAALYVLGETIQTSYRCYVLLVNGATVFLSYYCFSKMSNQKTGLVCTAVYSLNLYRLCCIDTRAAVGEFSAMTFLPLILYGIWRVYTLPEDVKEHERSWLPITAGCSGVFLSHIISTEITAFFLLLVSLILWKKTFRKKTLLVLFKAIAATILLNLWFLVPFLDEMASGNYVVTSPYAYMADRLEERGVTITQLFMGAADTMPLTLGWASMGVLIFWVLFCCFQKRREGAKKKEYLIIFLCILSLFMTTKYFPYTWFTEKIPALRMAAKSIQFPWRFYPVAGLLLSFLLCLILQKDWMGRRKRTLLAGVLICLSVWQGLSYQRTCMNEFSPYYVDWAEDVSTFSVAGGEYLPVDSDGDFVLYEYMKPYLDQLTYDTNVISIEDWRREKGAVVVSLTNLATDTQQIEVPLLLYKGYHAITDSGQELSLSPANRTGLRWMFRRAFLGVSRWHLGNRGIGGCVKGYRLWHL
ncbi:MAG: hypothetical protein NC318_11100 [Blautia sp.]|nr:hypothetical protein [Lachnoclostridium sp.]MCM1212139.1 hypothetical protein [Blautia sp.]